MASIGDWLAQRGIEVVVVAMAPSDRLRRYQLQHQWPFRILSDPDRTVYHQLQLPRLTLRRLFSLPTLRTYWRLMWQRRFSWRHGGDDMYQAGGDAMIRSDGSIAYLHRSQDPADRPGLAVLQRALAEEA